MLVKQKRQHRTHKQRSGWLQAELTPCSQSKAKILDMAQCEEADSLYDGFKKFEHLANQLEDVFAEVKRMVKGYEVSGAVEAALAKVEANADSFNEATKVAGRRLGNLTVVHAMLRELGDGELRRHLMKRAAKGLIKKPRLTVDPRLHLLLDRELNAKVG